MAPPPSRLTYAKGVSLTGQFSSSFPDLKYIMLPPFKTHSKDPPSGEWVWGGAFYYNLRNDEKNIIDSVFCAVAGGVRGRGNRRL